MNRLVGALLLLGLTGCATGLPTGARSAAFKHQGPMGPPSFARAIPHAGDADGAPAASLHGGREDVVKLARSLLGKTKVTVDGRSYPDDCTGLVSAVFDRVGVPLVRDAQAGDNAVTAMFRYASAHGRIFEGGRPLPGDLVFFKETYDQNRDGRANDGLTHIAIVDDVSDDGTVTVIHRVRRGVVRYRMNLSHRSERKDSATGAVLNDLLRAPGGGRREVLTGELFAAYGSVLPTSVSARR